jgi:hypothetical protein
MPGLPVHHLPSNPQCSCNHCSAFYFLINPPIFLTPAVHRPALESRPADKYVWSKIAQRYRILFRFLAYLVSYSPSGIFYICGSYSSKYKCYGLLGCEALYPSRYIPHPRDYTQRISQYCHFYRVTFFFCYFKIYSISRIAFTIFNRYI